MAEMFMIPPDLPPVKNKFLYAYRIFIKLFSFTFFGLCSVFGSVMILPPMRLVLHPRARFQKYARRFVSAYFRFFISMLHFLGLLTFKPGNREKYRSLSSKIIVANHPSLLDVVLTISLIPNADCITNTYLKRNILTGMVRQLYIINSEDLDSTIEACMESLKMGNCLVIFPEGTRTPRSGKAILKKGAARIALSSGCNIVPIHIGGTDKYGLGKKDPWISYNPQERWLYSFTMGNEINPENYKDLPVPAAAKAITDEIKSYLFSENR